MRKRDLEICLERVAGFSEPDPAMEQYMTPARIAADIIFEAYRRGDIADLKVMDLGCGTGMLSIASWLAEAGMVVGYDASEAALSVARSNAEALGAEVEFKLSDIRSVDEGADTVVMNPPFGCQRAHADRPFLEKALALSDCVYSIHMAETIDFVESFCEARGKSVFWRRTYKYEIPHLFSFHTRASQTVEVAAVGIR
ncbi:MAG: METTL5 family protein [Thermoplasmata archaeon]|nr:METTL5 family protein [Thermoplasmata archaeon]